MPFRVDDSTYDTIDTNAEAWKDLASDVQDDLAARLNVDPDEEDKQGLLRLYVEGRFRAWDCPHCEERTRVYSADVLVKEWDHFQGTRCQDFNYFGDRDKYTEEYINAMCDSCRCYG